MLKEVKIPDELKYAIVPMVVLLIVVAIVGYRVVSSHQSFSYQSTPAIQYCHDYSKSYAFVSAFEYCYEAAREGDALSQLYLGYMYWRGKGVSRNRSEARKWLEKAAIQGHKGAQEILRDHF